MAVFRNGGFGDRLRGSRHPFISTQSNRGGATGSCAKKFQRTQLLGQEADESVRASRVRGQLAAAAVPLARSMAYITGTMLIPFLKMHGAGNDFVIIDERASAMDFSPEHVRRLSDRRRGIGCDQFITLHRPPPLTDADVLMRIRNPDGSDAGACGNATRCVAELLFEENGRPYQVIRTVAGDLPAERLADGRIRVDMGLARTGWAEVPLARDVDTLHLPLAGDPGHLFRRQPARHLLRR